MMIGLQYRYNEKFYLTSDMDTFENEDEGYDIPHPLWKVENREETFQNWNNPYVNIKSLASIGFIYVGPNDKVKCVYCYLTIDEWLSGDDPLEKHRQLNPDCPYIEILQKEKYEEQEKLSIVVAKFPTCYQYEEERMKTFEDWPKDHPISPTNLVDAGFFYTNVRDKVKCFACNLEVEQWEPHDDVFVEHCRFSPKCSFMKLKKGNEFIMQCNSGANATEPIVETSPSASGISYEVMNETLLLQGFNRIFIDCAFFQQNIKNETPFANSESLFEAICKLPGAEAAASGRIKEPYKINDAEIALMKMCKICLETESKYICVPCKHFTCCEKCRNRFKDCPTCKKPINFERVDSNDLLHQFSSLTL